MHKNHTFPAWRRISLKRYCAGQGIGDVRQRAGKNRRREAAGFLQPAKHAGPTIRDMKILNFIHVTVARAFYSWAMKEINPMHPDVPRIMQRQRELEDKAQRIFA
jgi:hypothetical protein